MGSSIHNAIGDARRLYEVALKLWQYYTPLNPGYPVALDESAALLREALEVVRTPNVALETSASNAPGVVKPVGDDEFLHVIMPMHI